MNSPRAAAVLIVALAVAACANGPPDRDGRPGPGGPDRRGPPGPPPQPLFISPAGEPFRATPRQAYPLAVWWNRLDPAGADRVSPTILIADFERAFAMLDLDRDGAIGPQEVTVYETKTVPEILRGGGRGLAGAAPYSLLNDPQPIRSADFNLDGRVTLAEYQRKAREVFVRLDRNKDGSLSRIELPTPMMADPKARLQGPGPGRGRPPGAPPGGGRGGPPGGGRGPR